MIGVALGSCTQMQAYELEVANQRRHSDKGRRSGPHGAIGGRPVQKNANSRFSFSDWRAVARFYGLEAIKKESLLAVS